MPASPPASIGKTPRVANGRNWGAGEEWGRVALTERTCSAVDASLPDLRLCVRDHVCSWESGGLPGLLFDSPPTPPLSFPQPHVGLSPEVPGGMVYHHRKPPRFLDIKKKKKENRSQGWSLEASCSGKIAAVGPLRASRVSVSGPFVTARSPRPVLPSGFFFPWTPPPMQSVKAAGLEPQAAPAHGRTAAPSAPTTLPDGAVPEWLGL